MAKAEIKFSSDAAKKFFQDLVRGVDGVENRSQKYINVLSGIVFNDVIDHFDKEAGPRGRWQAWSKIYAERMRKVGKGNNKILQDSGRLRGSFKPTNNRKTREGIMWFNNAKTAQGFPYAAAHDRGGKKLPQREFMYLSDKALGKIESATLKFIEASK